MPDIKVRVGQTNAVKVVASAFGGSLTAENAQNAINVIGGIASVTQLYNSGISTFVGIVTTGGDLYVGGDLYINDDLVLDEITGRNANITGIATVGTLSVTGNTATGTLLVTGIATIGGATISAGAFQQLKVTGISTLSGPVGLGSDLNVVGISTFNENVKFIGKNTNMRWNHDTSDLTLWNNTRLVFGDNEDFQMWHGGTHTFLKNTGGDLRIRGNKILLKREDGSETYLEANVNNEVKLFFNGVEKVATTLHGIQVSGTTSTTQLGVSGVSTFSGAIDANGQIVAAEISNQIPFVYTNYSDLPVDPDNGLFAQVTERGKAFYAHNSNWYELVNKQVNGTIGVGTERYNIGPTNVTTLNVSGIATFASDVSIGGTLTYEDVTNIDSVGLITARSGVRISSGGLNIVGLTTGLHVSGVSTFTGDLYVASNIRHIGDTDTYIEFNDDKIRLLAGGKGILTVQESSVDTLVVNDGSNNCDFRVEGLNDEHLIFSDGGTDTVGIGSAIPTAKLDVGGTANVSGTLTAGLIDGGSF